MFFFENVEKLESSDFLRIVGRRRIVSEYSSQMIINCFTYIDRRLASPYRKTTCVVDNPIVKEIVYFIISEWISNQII